MFAQTLSIVCMKLYDPVTLLVSTVLLAIEGMSSLWFPLCSLRSHSMNYSSGHEKVEQVHSTASEMLTFT